MNLFKFLTRNEPVLGMEISDSGIRLAFLHIKKEKKGESKIEIKTLIETSLPNDAVISGKIKNRDIFLGTLSSLLKKIKPKIKYAVVSIPSDNVYSKLFSFPKTIGEEKLKETMHTISDFQLPHESKDIYSDWEEGKENDNYLAFLAASDKRIIDEYLGVILEAGISPIAIETHQMSIVRALKKAEKPYLGLVSYRDGVLAFIFKNGIIRFSRFLPKTFADKKNFDAEVKKICDFYKAESGEAVEISDFKDEKKAAKLGLAEGLILGQEANDATNKWLVALGAAMRGVMPRSEDVLVSLMPIGTEEAYENQKALAFAKFISNAVVAVSIFFIIIYAANLLLMISIGKNFSNQISALNSAPMDHDIVELENDARNFNELIAKVNGVISAMPEWSPLLEELKSRSVDGIAVSNLSLPSPADQMTIVGTASNRGQLNLYRKSLEESSWLTGVNMPLTNLAQKENIPFSITFRLKDPSSLNIK